MLIAYHEEYLFLIRTCALFCVLVMLYNLYDHIVWKRRGKQHGKRVETLRHILENYSESTESEQQSMLRSFKRLVRNPNGLLALLTALDELEWEDGSQIPEQVNSLLTDTLTQARRSIHRYSEDYIHCLYIRLVIRCQVISNQINSYLLECMSMSQLLVQVEALRCICIQQNHKIVIQALERISATPLPFSNKLITDILMTFQGNTDILLKELWAALPRLSAEVQVSVLQVLAAVDTGTYAQNTLELLKKEKVDTEVRIAAIKYFGSVSAPECVPILADFITAETWEYAAVAAKTLENYDCSNIFDVLKTGVCNRNWYVRNNCARTIVRRCTPAQLQDALNVSDRYGRDSIRYAMQTIEKEVAAV